MGPYLDLRTGYTCRPDSTVTRDRDLAEQVVRLRERGLDSEVRGASASTRAGRLSGHGVLRADRDPRGRGRRLGRRYDGADGVHAAGGVVHHADIVSLKGDSYRLKDRDLGRVPTDNTD
jgi:hypothetical protein